MDQPNHPAPLSIQAICRLAPVMVRITLQDLQEAVPLAEALVAGGLPVLQLDLRSPEALDALPLIARVPGAVAGAASVLTPADASEAWQAGAQFGVTPGCSHRVIDLCEDTGLPLLPGAATATEVLRLMERGFSLMQFFPAGTSGGPAAIAALAQAFPHVHFCAAGGICAETAADYLALPSVVSVSASWPAPRHLVEQGEWHKIRELAHQARLLGNGYGRPAPHAPS